jgi:hypothetical protein
MSMRQCFSSAAIAVLLTAGLVALPTAAVAAGPSDLDKEKIPRFEWAAASQMERTESKRSLLSLRLFGGYGRAETGDLNEGLDGFYEVFKLYSAQGFGTTTGGYNPLRDGYHAGADLVFQITPRIGIGIGAGYMRFSESSHLTFSQGSSDIELSSTPTLSAVPIRLGLFLTLPLGERLNLLVGAAAVAHAGLRLDAKQRIDYMGGYWAETTISAKRGASIDDLGFQGSLGFELKIFPNTGFFVEAVAHYARFENFESATGSKRFSDGDSETIKGRIYLATYTESIGEYSILTVLETPPASVSPNEVYKEPKIDLSGFSLQTGFRIRL